MDDRCGHESYNETDLTTPADLIWNRDTKKSWIRSLLGLDGEFTSVGYVYITV